MVNPRTPARRHAHEIDQRKDKWTIIASQGLVAVRGRSLDAEANGVICGRIKACLRKEWKAGEGSCWPHAIDISGRSVQSNRIYRGQIV